MPELDPGPIGVLVSPWSRHGETQMGWSLFRVPQSIDWRAQNDVLRSG